MARVLSTDFVGELKRQQIPETIAEWCFDTGLFDSLFSKCYLRKTNKMRLIFSSHWFQLEETGLLNGQISFI